MISNEQAAYLSNYLVLKKSGEDFSKLGTSLMSSKIALNPHQIDAALSFFKNPFQKGLILADEVGLGKTIEAGLVVSQYWYEKKRKILIITPASLMKQWNEEIYEKFYLESVLLSGKHFKEPLFKLEDKIYITSLNSIYLNKQFFNKPFDLVVIDEAHKLRNVYKSNGILASAIKDTFEGTKKILLTATPFQNNLMELYGLMSIIDDEVFGTPEFFRSKYVNNYASYKNDFHGILDTYIVRTLRKNVIKYINYTKRLVEIFEFGTSPEEIQFYYLVTNILYNDDFTKSYKVGQSQLLIILLQKLLSSSMYAVCKTLSNMRNNLITKNNLTIDDVQDLEQELECTNLDFEIIVKNIDKCLEFSSTIKTDSKYNNLKKSLDKSKVLLNNDENRNNKILIFTESKQTQEYLKNRLIEDGYSSIISFNGDNSSEEVKDIYINWLIKTNQIGSQINKSINVRRAIIDAFENEYEIMIATDAAAEGLNMQFCSIIVNYDLPWNPQKIEQRIGRCHRYGQKNDVIVINMLNTSISIDKHIYTLLNSKLGIFEETFGSSDLILGNTNIADDVESKIKNIFTTCRNPEEINKAFERIQKEFEDEIQQSLKISEGKLEQFFDEEIQRSFDLQFVKVKKIVNEFESIFWQLLKHHLNDEALFNEKDLSFTLKSNDETFFISNNRNLDSGVHYCSINSKLGESSLSCAKDRNLSTKLYLDYINTSSKIGFIDNSSLKNGILVISKITYDSFELIEDLVITGCFDDGTDIPSDICHKILKLECIKQENTLNNFSSLSEKHKGNIKNSINIIEIRNNYVFKIESDYINSSADNQIEAIQLKVSEMRNKRRELQLEFGYSNHIQKNESIQKEIQLISKKISSSWMELADTEGLINERRNNLMINLSKENTKQIIIEDLLKVEFIIK